ncbi:hypothetical protein [Microterricola viridarii]|uniref:Uncharacterized protein n=1 Tax=Microterricola viridarii TaxID=412690 RepID=A0A0X8E3I8_9MICO|nr:hypothetical protein [Microterricola viridarii]AMB59054.1 hypothetical protein AWU67_09520 [Microterricola viridarii]
MSVAERGIRVAAATLPASMRKRYREQWLADVRDADELGLSRAAIVAGAFTFSMRLGRTAEVRGYAVTELMMRRVRWGLALVISSPVVLVTLWMTGTLSSEPGSPLALLVAAAGRLSLTVMTLGFLLLIAAARGANRMALVGTALVAVGLLGVVVPAALATMLPGTDWVYRNGVLAAAIPLLIVLAVVGAFLALIGFARGLAHVEVPTRTAPGSTKAATRARAGLVAFVLLALLLAFGSYETLVLSPLTMAPGYELSEIYALLSPPDRSWGIMMVMIWLVFWSVAVLALLALCLLRGRLAAALNVLLTPRRLTVYALLLGAVIIFFQGWSGFSLGMSISDTIPPFAGGRSWQGQALSALGALSFVVAIMLALVPGPRRAPVPAASAA